MKFRSDIASRCRVPYSDCVAEDARLSACRLCRAQESTLHAEQFAFRTRTTVLELGTHLTSGYCTSVGPNIEQTQHRFRIRITFVDRGSGLLATPFHSRSVTKDQPSSLTSRFVRRDSFGRVLVHSRVARDRLGSNFRAGITQFHHRERRRSWTEIDSD